MNTNRILKLNSLINESKSKPQKLTKKETDEAVKMLHKKVDLNAPDDFAVEMIIISMDELMKRRVDKKQAKEILKAFDKKYTRITKDFDDEEEY